MNPRIALVALLLMPHLVFAGPRLDRNGDPLPDGAIARFGSGRLLHGGVSHMEFSPDGKVLATSGGDGTRLWDVATGKEVVRPHLPRTGHVVLTFTPEGAHVVGDDRDCRVIDPATGKVRCFWRNPGKRPKAVVVAADGKSAATAWQQGGVTVHDLTDSGKSPGHKFSDDDVGRLVLSGDGGLLACATMKSVQVWDVRQRKLLHTYPATSLDYASCPLCLSRDGRRLVIASDDKLHLWDTASHEEVKEFAGPALKGLSSSTSVALFVQFSANGAELEGVFWEKRQMFRWSATTGKELARSSPPAEKYDRYYHPTLSADGRTAAAVMDGGITLWDVASGKTLVPVERGPEWRGIAFVKPGVLATFTRGRHKGEQYEEVLAFWDVTDGKLLRKHAVSLPESEWWRRALSPDGTLFAAEDSQKGVRLFDVETGKEVLCLKVRCREDEQAKFAFGPDGKTIVTSDKDGLRVWDVATGKPLREVEGISDGIIAVSPDGRSIASAFVGSFILTEVASGKARHRLRLPKIDNPRATEDVVEGVRFAGNGRSVMAVSPGYITVFATDSGNTLLRLEAEGGPWEDAPAALSPDGRWLAHADRGAVAVRDLNSPRAASEYQMLSGHAGSVEAVEFSPDGKYLVSCGKDGTALVWDARLLTGKPTPPERDATALDADEVQPHWDVLATADPGKAASAMAALVESPDTAVPLLKARLKPATAPTELEGPVTDPELLRHIRTVEVLERIATPAAREVLEALAKGAPAARLTREAKASLERWR
jgi:WD40 repeat protein